MIDQGKENALDFFRHHAQATLHGGKLAQMVIRVLGKDWAFRALHTGADFVGLGADYHHYRRTELREDPGQPVQKCFPPEFQQRFGGSHTHRLTRRQNQSGDTHFDSAREDSSAKTDMDSERQFDFGLRRTAIISATTEMAISSGDIAPISRPIGAWIRSSCWRDRPSFSSS